MSERNNYTIPRHTYTQVKTSPLMKHYEDKSVKPNSALVRLIRFTNTINFTTDLANIKTQVLDRVLAELEAGTTIDKYDSTFFVDLEEYAMHWARLLVNLAAMKFQNDKIHSLARDDSTAGKTLTTATWKAQLDWLKESAPEIPIFAVAIARLYMFGLQLADATEDSGESDTFVMFVKPTYTLADINTAIGNIESEYVQAKPHINRIKMKCVKFSEELITFQIVTPYSQIGHALYYWWPGCDDTAVAAGTEYLAMDANRELVYYSFAGIGEINEALVAWRPSDDSANGCYFLTTLASAAAGKITAETVSVGGTAFTALDDTETSITGAFGRLAATQSLGSDQWLYHGLMRRVLAGKVWTAAGDYAVYFYKYLLRKQRLGQYMPMNSGIEPSPDRLGDRRMPFRGPSRNPVGKFFADLPPGAIFTTDPSGVMTSNTINGKKVVGYTTTQGVSFSGSPSDKPTNANTTTVRSINEEGQQGMKREKGGYRRSNR